MDLFRNPRALFVGGPDSDGAAVTLWPNGEDEIWIQDRKGAGFRITASRGPHGLGLQISRFCGSPAMTISANGAGIGPNIPAIRQFDASDIEICQYDETATAQEFKTWYGKDRT